MSMVDFLLIGVSVVLVALVLLQQRGNELGSAFGGGAGEFFVERRGLEKLVFYLTIAAGALFLALSLVRIFYQ